tara:strand:+ start:209 stop:604 length:396 start_codon:yes stop_codon:yes gene_type:complete
MNLIKVVAGVIFDKNRFLIARRKKGKKLEYLWEYPGGKVEEKENDEDALKRELFEEFEIEIAVKKFITESYYDYGEYRINLRAYFVEHLAGDFKLKDHDDIAWISKKELSKYEFAPADLKINEFLKKNFNV